MAVKYIFVTAKRDPMRLGAHPLFRAFIAAAKAGRK